MAADSALPSERFREPSVEVDTHVPVDEDFSNFIMSSSSRPKRKRVLPARMRDFTLHSDGRLLEPDFDGDFRQESPIEDDQMFPTAPNLRLTFRGTRTERDELGVHREYLARPLDLVNNRNGAMSATMLETQLIIESIEDAVRPFPNYSAFRLCSWYWNHSGTLSDGHFRQLFKEVFSDPQFNQAEVCDLDINKLKKQVAEHQFLPFSPKVGWQERAVNIPVPLCIKGDKLPGSIDFEVPGFHFRSIVNLYTQIIEHSSESSNFTWVPFREYISKSEGPGGDETRERIYGELYSSDAFIKEFHRLQNSQPEPDCDAERLIVGLMFWSDATLLANFGTASLWPIYMAIGNQSKYERSRPSKNSMFDVAYLPSVCNFLYQRVQKSYSLLSVLAPTPFSRFHSEIARYSCNVYTRYLLQTNFNACLLGYST